MKPHYETVRDAEKEQHNSPNLDHSNREQINRQPWQIRKEIKPKESREIGIKRNQSSHEENNRKHERKTQAHKDHIKKRLHDLTGRSSQELLCLNILYKMWKDRLQEENRKGNNRKHKR